MFPKFASTLLCLAALLCAGVAAAWLVAPARAANSATVQKDKSWVGESVLNTKPHKEIRFGDRKGDIEVVYSFSGHFPYQVREEKDGWLRIHDRIHEGWVLKTDFVLARDAIDYFTRRIDANPKDGFALQMRGAAWLQMKEPDKALRDFDARIALRPSPGAYNNRGLAWRDKKDYDKAIADYSEAIRLSPKFSIAYINRGVAYRLKKDYDQAIKNFDDVISIDSRYAAAWYHRGICWTYKKEYNVALKDLDEALRLDPKYADAFYRKAGCLALAGQVDAAFASLQRAVELGYRNFEYMARDQFLDSIRGDARFEQLVKKYAK
jgi:tetratricopeptide (TPR) repeat protein